MPPDSVFGNAWAKSPRPIRSRYLRQICACCAAGTLLLRRRSPNMMFCSTVSQGKTPYSWKITPRSRPGPAMGRLSSVTRPAVGCTKPAMMFISVVLPQPEGPTMQMKSFSWTLKDTSSTTRSGPWSVGKSTETFSKTMRVLAIGVACLNGPRPGPASGSAGG